MANEFVIKNGFHSQGNSQVTGSLNVTGGITGSILGTSSFALTSSYINLTQTASYVLNATSASYIQLQQGPGITINGLAITSSLRTVNGNSPDNNGNVAVSLAAVLTGTSASLIASSSGTVTGSITEGTVWIISGDPDATKNGDAYIFDSGSVGQWLAIAPLDQTSADARYARINIAATQNLTASFASTASYITGSIFTSTNRVLSSSYALTASFALNAGGGSGNGFPYDGTVTPALVTGSLIVSGSGIRITGSLTSSQDILVSTNMTIGRGKNPNQTNTAVGFSTLGVGVTTTWNTAVGYHALSSSNATNNTAVGAEALKNMSTGTGNTAVGRLSLVSGSSGIDNTAIGYFSLNGNSGSFNTAIGKEAAWRAGDHNSLVAIGTNAAGQSLKLNNTVVIGNDAGKNIPVNTNDALVLIGAAAGQYLKASNGSTYIGSTAGYFAQGTNNTAIGSYALQGGLLPTSLTSSGGGYNIAIGTNAMQSPIAPGANIGQYNTAIGESAFAGATSISGSYNTVIGRAAMFSGSKGSYNAIIGTNAGYYNFAGSQNTIVGYNAGYRSPSSSFTTLIGTEAGYFINSVTNIVSIGYQAGYYQYQSPSTRASQYSARTVAIGTQAMYGTNIYTNEGTDNTVIGDSAMYSASISSYNSVIGGNALYNNLSGSYNVSLGHNSLNKQVRGNYNVSIGNESLYNNLSGSNNIAIGYQALYGQTNSTLQTNTAIGLQAGYYASQSSTGNIYIGPNAGPSSLTTQNSKLYISSGSGNPLIGGDFAAKTVTISGSLLISGSIIPNTDNTQTSSFNLGSPTAAWKALYVATKSIHFMDEIGNEVAKISARPDGAIEVPSLYTTGSVTVNTIVSQSTTYIVQEYYATGSNKFGSSSLDTHQFTGSVLISGAMYISDVQQALGSNIITFDTSSGRLYYTSSNSLIDPQGTSGVSAYQSWLDIGNTGTEEDFINSLQGQQGPTGPIGPTGPVGDAGATGPQGDPGIGFTELSPGLLAITSSLQFSGSVDSLYGYTGSLYGTSSLALTSSYFDGIINGGTF